MAIDYSTDVGKVRLLISDADEDNFILTADQINGFLAIESGIKKAAAAALDSIATSEALIGKVIRTQDLQTDGAKLADSLRKRAETLRKEDDEDAAFFDVVNFDPHRRLSKFELAESEE